ncbi:uncharacterized protein N7496_004206 [Penicillium cataractarum]|uniref:Alpha/beta hydrolase fold-3 domain-containing protein n=1 Tax=Penicillium cataractarum TaxID=2100454 RepID=A0A9W9SSS0_9EURO|nr:uncharacterized protein N7496_004206 [Penicillium cataractarum]KAJ5381778.1 hypothetical protein N7496_004206 [Penicillium cataractarum]
MPINPPSDPTLFKDFEVNDFVYKTVGDHDIGLSILVPKNLLSEANSSHGKRPVITRFHGGFLVGGTRTYTDWFPKWLLELAISRQAILVTPDYRLLPESSGLDILSDLDSFWSWMQNDFEPSLSSAYPSSTIKPDLGKILVAGESAGGYLAAQSMLLHPEVNMAAVILVYPMVHLRDRFWDESYEKPMYGSLHLPFDKVEQHLRELTDGPIVTADERLERGAETNRSDIAVRIVQNGKFLDFLGRQSEVFPVENISRATKLPSLIWIFHGKQDTAVPFYGSERFVEELRTEKPGVNVRFEGYDGDHGFDDDAVISEGWMKDGMSEVGKYW